MTKRFIFVLVLMALATAPIMDAFARMIGRGD
jgi:hypothetical protein